MTYEDNRQELLVTQVIDLGGKQLIVTQDEIVLDAKRLRIEKITAIRYGAVTVQNAVVDGTSARSYAFWFTDGYDTIHVECKVKIFQQP